VTRAYRTASTVTAEQIASCSARLTKDHVEILTASLDGGYAAAAELFGLPLGTVKSRLNRARTALAAALAKSQEATDASQGS